ncbi:MAG: transcriptional regulator [Candidatus Bathyarchaeia archaeon]
MVSKDQAIGWVIFLVCLIVGILYTVGLFYYGVPQNWNVAFWLIAIPVFIAFIAIMGIGAWIGWTMATTPPPKPIEEITSEIEEEEKKEEKVEEKVEEPKEAAETEEKTEEKGKGKAKK